MLANAWVFEMLRWFGAGYLIFLAVKSARSALKPGETELRGITQTSLKRTYLSGLALHLTNTKALLFLGALYAVGVPAPARPVDLATVTLTLGPPTGTPRGRRREGP